MDVEQDYAESFKWCRLAAEQGNAKAQCNLAVMYVTGKGVEQNIDEAEYWAEKAVESGVERAEELLEKIRNLRNS